MIKIHSTSIVEDRVKLGQNVEIGPYCHISGEVEIGENVVIKSHVSITGKVKISDNCTIFPFVAIGGDPQKKTSRDKESAVIIGKNCIIRELVTISGGTPQDKMTTVIGNDCLFMASSHIAHDCIIGNGVVLANNVAIAGHVKIGNNVNIGGNAAIHQFCRIGDFCMLSGLAPVHKDIIPYSLFTTAYQKNDSSYAQNGIMGVNLVGLKRNGFTKKEILEIIDFFNKVLGHSNNQDIDLSIYKRAQKNLYILSNESAKNLMQEFIVDGESKQGFYQDILKERMSGL